MDAQNFCYWLKGYFELLSAGPKNPEKLVLTAEQVEMIEKHLNYVFAEKPKPYGAALPGSKIQYTDSLGSLAGIGTTSIC